MKEKGKINLIGSKFRKTILFGFLFLSFVYGGTSVRANAASVSLSATPTLQTINVGKTATYTIKINRDGYADKVTLSATGLPAGASATFAPNTTTATSSVLTVKTLTTTPIGTFNITVKGTANGITIAPITVKLTTKAGGGSISVSVTPATQSIIAGQSTFYDVAIKRTNYEGAVKLTAENLPSGITVQFEPSITTGSTSRMYLYSTGLPFFPNQFSMLVRARGIADTVENWITVYVVVNCGINWAEQFPAPDNNTNSDEYTTAVTFDTNESGNINNVYAAGYTKVFGSMDKDVWIAKFDRYGVKQWLQIINNSTTDEYAKDIAVDSAGNVYVAGYYRTQNQFVNYDIYVAKFSANGVAMGYQSSGTNYEDGSGGMVLNFNTAGNLVLTATADIRRSGIINYDIRRYEFDANFNPPGQVTLLTDKLGDPGDIAVAATGEIYVVGDGFIEKFNSSGNSVWREDTLNTGIRPKRVALDSNNDAYVATENSQVGALHFAGLRKYDSNHTFGSQPVWIHQESASQPISVETLEVGLDDRVYYGGAVNDNGWFSKHLAATGNVIYRREFVVANLDGFSAIKAGNNGDLVIGGFTVLFKNINFGYRDALLMKYTANSCFFW